MLKRLWCAQQPTQDYLLLFSMARGELALHGTRVKDFVFLGRTRSRSCVQGEGVGEAHLPSSSGWNKSRNEPQDWLDWYGRWQGEQGMYAPPPKKPKTTTVGRVLIVSRVSINCELRVFHDLAINRFQGINLRNCTVVTWAWSLFEAKPSSILSA